MNGYAILADLVVVLHLAYMGFVVLGMLAIALGLVLRWRWVRNFWFRTIHFAAIAVVVVESLAGVVCPLTTLENALRRRAGETQFAGSFVGRLAHDLLFFEASEWVFTTCYVLFGLLVLVTLVFAPPRWPRKHDSTA